MSKAVVTDERTTLREANIARQKEWDAGNQITLTYRGNELAGEVGEACNIMKKLERERLGIRGSRATVEQLAEELADIVICTDLVAMSEGIDLDAAVAAKFNATSEKVGLATRLVPLSHGAEAVEPEQKPVAWYREGFLVNFSLGEARPWGATSDPNEWKPLYASPVRSAQEAVSDLDIQIAYEAWIDRTIGARAPITAFYAGYRAALLPPGGETATPDSGRTE